MTKFTAPRRRALEVAIAIIALVVFGFTGWDSPQTNAGAMYWFAALLVTFAAVIIAIRGVYTALTSETARLAARLYLYAAGCFLLAPFMASIIEGPELASKSTSDRAATYAVVYAVAAIGTMLLLCAVYNTVYRRRIEAAAERSA